MLTIVLASFDGIEGVDPVGVLFVFVLLYCFDRSEYFCPLFVLAPFTNEKVVLAFVFLVAGRLVFVKGFYRSHRWQIATVVGGLAIYLAALKLIGLPGNEGQTEFSRRLPLLLLVSKASVSSLKGVVRNILPALVIVIPCLLFAIRKEPANQVMDRSDLVVALGMLATGLTLTESTHFQVGRIVFYAMPLTVIAAVTLIGALDAKGSPQRSAAIGFSDGKSDTFGQSQERVYIDSSRASAGSTH
jgi:hypothetical protein